MHGKQDSLILAQLILFKTGRSQTLGTGPLHEFKIVGVIYYTAAIRIFIIDTNRPTKP
jgi:hypothetical protein